MNNKSTPGPWKHESIDDQSIAGYMVIAHKACIASISNLYGNADANARLIAAAPELLEIAKAYRNLLKTMAHTEGEVSTYHHIESVIAKAEGK